MSNAIIYARFSPRRNEEECTSNDTQIALCRDYCARNGLTVVGEYQDEAESGADETRPGLWAAIEALKPGYTLVVYRLDRLARKVHLAIVLEQQIERRGARIASIAGEGTLEDSAEGWLIRKILQTLAEYERRLIAARTRAAMRHHQANGRRMSNKTPYGWERDPQNPALMVHCPEEQQVLGQILELHEQGKGLRAICRELEDQGIKCRGGKWHHTTIKAILGRAGVA